MNINNIKKIKKKYFISHRGNLNGPDLKYENTYEKINFALKNNLEVEIDVRMSFGKLYLGHDKPQDRLDMDKIIDISKIWFHCKDIECMHAIKKMKIKKFFFHHRDDVTLTSNGLFWTYPGKKVNEYSIIVLPEKIKNLNLNELLICAGICSDYINQYKND